MPKIKELDSFSEVKDHIYDNYTNLGFNYRRNIMRLVSSPELFSNSLLDTPLRQIERMFETAIDAVRKVKLHYAISFPKNSKLIN